MLTDFHTKCKTTTRNGRDWDERFALCVVLPIIPVYKLQPESPPFFLLYGRDAQLPTEAILSPTVDRHIVDCDDYRGGMATKMKEAWEMANKLIKTSQDRPKKYFDRHAKPGTYRIGERVFYIHASCQKQDPHISLLGLIMDHIASPLPMILV